MDKQGAEHQCRAMLVSLGGSPEPVLYSLNQKQPAYILLFVSAESVGQIREVIQGLTFPWQDIDRIVSPSAEILGDCYRALRDRLPEKLALWGVTRTLAQALAPRIRVNAIGPGPVLKSAHQTDEEFRRQCEATILGRGTTPEEIANAILFILDAPAMTGQMIALDGGQHLAWDTPDVRRAPRG